MSGPAQRYPLSWPAGWKRTKPEDRQRASFGKVSQGSYGRGKRELSVFEAVGRLQAELGRLGAGDEILSTNVKTRLDGTPRSDRAEPQDPGAAVYFDLAGRATVFACDRWRRVADNIAAIAEHVRCLRGIDRYGVGSLEQAFAGYAALPPTHEDWWLVLGVRQDATREQIEEAYRRLVREHHPDVGGSHDAMARINRARDVATAARRG